jgi:UDP-GlcNAc:undecaprenyl-phosphate GlcNAc-1-phosphate transferase
VTDVEYVVLYGAAFLVPFACVLLLTPLAAKVASRLGVIDRPGDHKTHLVATPYLGGAAVAGGLVIAGFVVGATPRQVSVIGGCSLVVFGLGLLDDIRGVPPIVRIAVEGVLGAVLWFAGVRAGLFGFPPLDFALTVAWIVGITNAVNLIDNMDGLASGVSAITSLAYFAIAAPQGDYLVAAFAAVLAGVSLGFLRHNFPPARIFLGDAGSLLLGFLLACLGLLIDLDVSGGLRLVIQALIMGVPVFDTALVVAARRRGGRSVIVGSDDHSSHRLARLGLSTRGVLGVICLSQFACATVAVAIANGSSAVLAIAAGWISVGLALVVLLRARRLRSPSRG